MICLYLLYSFKLSVKIAFIFKDQNLTVNLMDVFMKKRKTINIGSMNIASLPSMIQPETANSSALN